MTQPRRRLPHQPTASVPDPAAAAAKPVHKKVVRKAPVTVTYADKTSGVSFQYPRKYSLKTGDAANQLISSDPVPMNFVQPGRSCARSGCVARHPCILTAIWRPHFSMLA